jgi:hypothetical protein
MSNTQYSTNLANRIFEYFISKKCKRINLNLLEQNQITTFPIFMDFFKQNDCFFKLEGTEVNIHIKLRPCQLYQEKGCKSNTCKSLHVCEKRLLNTCQNKCCLNHTLVSNHNARALRQFKIENVDPILLLSFYQVKNLIHFHGRI